MAAAKGCSRMLVAAALMCLLVAATPCGAAGVLTCEQVESVAAPCLDYVKGVGTLKAPCCESVREFNTMLKTPADRQAACRCVKTLAGQIPGLKPEIFSALPGKCGVSMGIPFSFSTDCSKVH